MGRVLRSTRVRRASRPRRLPAALGAGAPRLACISRSAPGGRPALLPRPHACSWHRCARRIRGRRIRTCSGRGRLPSFDDREERALTEPVPEQLLLGHVRAVVSHCRSTLAVLRWLAGCTSCMGQVLKAPEINTDRQKRVSRLPTCASAEFVRIHIHDSGVQPHTHRAHRRQSAHSKAAHPRVWAMLSG